jgi:hypothetical protein
MLMMQGTMRGVLKEFVATFLHKAATSTDLLCHFAATLASVPIATVASSVPECSFAYPSAAEGHGLVVGDRHGQDIDNNPQGNVEAVYPWLQRLQAWMTFPGIPVLELRETSTKEGYHTVELHRKEMPWLASSRIASWYTLCL